MLLKVIVLTILITSVFEKIKTEKFPYQASQLWHSIGESEETKEFSSKEYYLLVKGNKEEIEMKDEDVSISMSEEVKEYNGNYQKDAKTRSNEDESFRAPSFLDKFKRQITVQQIINGNGNNPDNSFEDISLSVSEESKESNSSEIFSDKFKRHIQSQAGNTDIKANRNRFFSLLNLPVQLNVLANVLSVLNQEVVGTEGNTTGAGGSSITGNNNQGLNLVDLPVDVKAVLNILSKVNQTGESNTDGPIEGNTNQQGLLGGLLGGLIGGGVVEGNGNLLGGVLGGDKNNGLVEGLLGDGLGNTLDDLLAGLLGNDAELGSLLGGILGTDQTNSLLGPLLENLLGAVGSIVENLLELLTALLEALLNGLSKTGATQNINSPIGSNNQIFSLINAPIKIEAFINILSSLKRQIVQQTNPNITTNSLLGGGSSLPGLTDVDTLIQRNNSSASNLLNLAPDANVNLNLLSEVTQLLNPGQNGNANNNNNNGNNSGSGLANPNEICFDIPIDQSGTSNMGNNNRFSGLVNIKPTINLDLNLLSKLTQTGGSIPSHIPTQRICITRPTTPATLTIPTTTAVTPTTKPNEICFDIPIDSSGNNNHISSLINIEPKINLDLNILSKLTQTGGSIPSNIPTQRICIPLPITPTPPQIIPTTTAVTPTTNPNEICFDIPIHQSGSGIINIDPKLNLVLNLLSQINQSGSSLPLKVQTQRICIPLPPTPTPTTVKPTTTTTPAPYLPITELLCLKRVCSQWLPTRDYKYITKRDEYPKYTFTYAY